MVSNVAKLYVGAQKTATLLKTIHYQLQKHFGQFEPSMCRYVYNQTIMLTDYLQKYSEQQKLTLVLSGVF
jgi:hypothetical protein